MIRVTEQNLVLAGLPDDLKGLRVCHLTDFHRGTTTSDKTIKEAIATANRLCPDVIIMTGDYVNHDPEDVTPIAEMLSELQASCGIYFISGNHDYYTARDAMTNALIERGIVSLINKSVCLDGGLWLCGVDDDRLGTPDIDAAFSHIPATATPLVLIHNPVVAERFRSRKCVAFAGHTHGGQINLPLIRDFALWKIGAKRYRAGWYDVGEVRLYVNQGIGNTGVRFRINAPPEVALFILQ